MSFLRTTAAIAALMTANATTTLADGLVGVQRFVMTSSDIVPTIDPDLAHVLSDLAGGMDRTLMIKIWYPARPGDISPRPHHYGFHTDKIDFALDPASFEDVLPRLRKNLVTSRTVTNAHPAEGAPRPVLFYSHGSGVAVETNDAYFEHLVSRGYIVVSVGHTYNTGVVTLNDGIVARQAAALMDYTDQELPEKDQDPNLAFTAEKALALAKIPVGTAPPAELLASYHYLLSEVSFGSRHNLDLWVRDTQFVLAELEALNGGQIENGLIDLFDFNRIGAVGYSFGGATARHFCDREPRCLVSVNIDGTDYSKHDEAIRDPHLRYVQDPDGFVAATFRNNPLIDLDPEYLREQVDQRLTHDRHALVSQAESDLIILTPADIAHQDFTLGWLDLHDFGPGKAVWHDVLEATSAAFLDTYLQPGLPMSESRSLCALTAPSDIVQLGYTNVCD